MRITIVGFGVVGQSLARVLLLRHNDLVKSYGINPKVVAIVDKDGAAVNPKGLDLEKMLTVVKQKKSVAFDEIYGHEGMSAIDVIEKNEAEVVVEVTPTNIKTGEPGLSHIKAALKSGKNVVTTNKGPLAIALPALTELAEYNKVFLRFSGTVGGGTPILDLAKRCLQGDRIISVRGILNGTTNYILTEMSGKDLSFQEALKNAQKLGYAEAEPSMDVDGFDAACKLVIIANWVMNKKATLKDVKIQGIRGVTTKDLKEAAKRNHALKLIGSINGDLKVMPTEISRDDPLCVGGNLNAVTFLSEFAGEETIIGRGAGGIETASSVIRDLIDIKQNLSIRI